MLELLGPTLTLRLPVDSDAPALFELGSDPELTRWFSWGPYRDPSEPGDWIRRATRAAADGERLALAIVRGDELLGVTELSERSARDRRAMIGTWIGPPAWGTGVNAESKAIALHLAFAVLGLRRVGAYANVANARSQRALEKIGFTREGTLRRWHRHGDRELDVYVYGLLAEEWSAPFPVVVRGAPPAAFVRPDATPS